jgi:hypothetical protein
MESQPVRNYTRAAVAIVIVALVIAGSIVTATYLGTNSTVTKTTTITSASTRTVTDTSTLIQYFSGTCLREFPQSALFGTYSNSTSQGYAVTFSNGTEARFPLNSCPVPVTPGNYQIDSTIEANPEFTAAENGHIYEATNACNCSWSANITGPGGQYASLNFIWYSNQQVYPCGPDSYWVFKQLGLIDVTIPIISGSLDFSNMTVEAGPGNTFYGCTTTTSTSTSTNNQSQNGQVTFYRTNGDWNFSVTLSSLAVPEGQPIDVYVSITNISGQTQTIDEVEPIINPSVSYPNGTFVWAWDPPAINLIANITVESGISGGPFVIPTSNLLAGQSYKLNITPLIGAPISGSAYRIGESLALNVIISVT